MQLDYNDLSAAVKGGLADSGFTDKVGRFSGADIGFGFGLAETAVPGDCDLPAATSFMFAGVSVQTNKPTQNATGEAQYDAGEEITVLRKGRIWVTSEVAVTPASPVFLRHTVNGALVPGNFRNDADTAKADAITNARFITKTTAANQLVCLEINLP